MTKKEAVEAFVEREFNSVPQEWVKIVAQHYGEYPNLPMWGTMWIVSNWLGERLWNSSRVMVSDKDDIDLEALDEKERKAVEEAIEKDIYVVLENYVDEEMADERCVLDKDGNPTSMFIYEIGDEYVVGIHGAGWDFYSGVWDRIYDTLGLHWHEEINHE